MRILIVEDELIIAQELKMQLEKLGYEEIFIVTSSEQAIKYAIKNLIDIVLMDIYLGENTINGIETMKEIQKQKNIFVLYLTGKKDTNLVLEASSTDPIGYLNKPFNYEDIKTTLLLAKAKISASSLLNIGEGYLYDTSTYSLYYNDEFIKLSKMEKNLLNLLIKNKDSIVSYSLIKKEIFEDGKSLADIDDSLRRLIYRLRKKLDKTNAIQTLSSQGIKIVF